MLLGCFYAKADDGLITQQITIKLDEAGTLPNKIENSQKYKITNLKIIGDINGTDIRMIRDMAGRDYNGKKTSGELSTLDLSEARIVAGGNLYFNPNDDDYKPSNFTDQIGNYTFYKCEKITNVTLPNNITKIGYSAFKDCTGLTSINIPECVTEIGENAFYGCTGLTNINIPNSVTHICNSAFEDCTGLTNINIPNSVTQIGNSAFSSCI